MNRLFLQRRYAYFFQHSEEVTKVIRFLSVIILALSLGACSSMKVADVDSKTGYFPTTTKANVLTSKSIDLDSRKSLLLIPNDEFVKGQIANIKYFDEIMTFVDLEKKIVHANLTDKVQSVSDRIGVSNAAKHYKNFLWFRFEKKGEAKDRRGQFILTDAKTMEDYFVAETKFDYVWSGVNDQNNWYPMFNALIDYIKQNSRTYRK
jgi:hypothetical protein